MVYPTGALPVAWLQFPVAGAGDAARSSNRNRGVNERRRRGVRSLIWAQLLGLVRGLLGLVSPMRIKVGLLFWGPKSLFNITVINLSVPSVSHFTKMLQLHQ